MANWNEQGTVTSTAVPGADIIAISDSMAMQSPEIVAESFLETIPCDGCAIFLVAEGEPQTFGRSVFRGFRNDTFQECVHRISERLALETLDDSHMIIPTRQDPTWAYADLAPTLRNVLGIP